MKNKIDDGRNYAGVIKRLAMEIIRPNDTTAYAAGDCVNNVSAKVAKVVTVTMSALSGESGSAEILGPGNLSKIFSAVTKQIETITLTGTSGTASITEAGGLTKTVTFASSLSTTALNFKTANAAAYLAVGIVLTNSGSTLIFTAQTAGVSFTKPVITNVTTNLAGTVATTYNPTLNTLVSTFVTEKSADYLAAGITLTSSGAGLIFTAATAGEDFVTPLVTTITGTITGTAVVTTANVGCANNQLTDAVLFPGGSGIILDAILEIKENTNYPAKVMTIYVFSEPITQIVDNALFTNLYANKDKLVAKFDITMGAASVTGSDSCIGQASPNKAFVCASGSTSLYAVIQTPAVSTNIANVKFNLTLLVKQL
jgi:hypothetical protein